MQFPPGVEQTTPRLPRASRQKTILDSPEHLFRSPLRMDDEAPTVPRQQIAAEVEIPRHLERRRQMQRRDHQLLAPGLDAAKRCNRHPEQHDGHEPQPTPESHGSPLSLRISPH
ncbi:hypothetical protein D9M72_585130 [compost metagenome]